jgi:hypothetical protein
MSLGKVVNVAEIAIFETVFLFFVPPVEDGTDKIVCFLPLHNVIKDLSSVLPHEVSDGQVASPHLDPILLNHPLLKKRLFLFILHLPRIHQQTHFTLIIYLQLPLLRSFHLKTRIILFFYLAGKK